MKEARRDRRALLVWGGATLVGLITAGGLLDQGKGGGAAQIRRRRQGKPVVEFFRYDCAACAVAARQIREGRRIGIAARVPVPGTGGGDTGARVYAVLEQLGLEEAKHLDVFGEWPLAGGSGEAKAVAVLQAAGVGANTAQVLWSDPRHAMDLEDWEVLTRRAEVATLPAYLVDGFKLEAGEYESIEALLEAVEQVAQRENRH